jgi:hypothetical protein
LKCPRCGAWTELLETRTRSTGEKARRYECGNEHRFTVIGDTYTEPKHKSEFARRGYPRIDRSPKRSED